MNDQPSDSSSKRIGKSGKGTLSAQQKWAAAEAVVQAALCCHEVQGQVHMTADTRRFLIEAVNKDPSLTERLFRDNLFRFPRC